MIDIDEHTYRMYWNTAEAFADRIEAIFSTEETLATTYREHFSAMEFDRTSHWNTILRAELKKVWEQHGPVVKSSLTLFDENRILYHLSAYLDYNLFTQVLLNLQPAALLAYRSGDAAATIAKLQAKWGSKSPSPFDAKPKMFKTAATADEQAYNRDLSTLKALRTITGLSTARSFRVSPKGATPALTDSENLSMVGIGGDQYLSPPSGFRAFYFTWQTAPNMLEEVGLKTFRTEGIAYQFESKSGGEILNSVLLARKIAYLVYVNLELNEAFQCKAVLPRMNSVLLVTNATDEQIAEVRKVTNLFPMIQFNEGARPEQQLSESNG
jgi:hypothetical protein